MQRDKLLILLVFVAVLSAVVGLAVLHGDNAQPPVAPPPPPQKASGAGEFRGISLQLHSSDPQVPFEQYVQEIADTGANTICFVVAAYQENCSSTSIFIDLRKTPPDDRVRSLIRLAKSKGLRVVFMPIVLLENARAGEWRGKIQPENWPDWWEDYEHYILHYVHIAQAENADLFILGSELVKTEAQEEGWRKLIAKARRHFRGRLSYSANWDHYKPVRWWDDLDVIGMTTYHDLTGGKEPTVERLMDSWAKLRREILAWQKDIRRPILFTEVGWPNLKTCAQYPWNYCLDEDPDPQAQANCFEAFFRTWSNTPQVAGYLVWEWRSWPGQPTGPEDRSYVPNGKPAMEVIRKYLNAPATTAPAETGEAQTTEAPDTGESAAVPTTETGEAVSDPQSSDAEETPQVPEVPDVFGVPETPGGAGLPAESSPDRDELEGPLQPRPGAFSRVGDGGVVGPGSPLRQREASAIAKGCPNASRGDPQRCCQGGEIGIEFKDLQSEVVHRCLRLVQGHALLAELSKDLA